jgi:hypothetical protein
MEIVEPAKCGNKAINLHHQIQQFHLLLKLNRKNENTIPRNLFKKLLSRYIR